MSPYLAGALGALALLLATRLARRAVWFARWRRFRRGGPLPIGRAFARLGVRPEQEPALRAELDALWREASALRRDAAGVPAGLADLLSAESFDAAAVSAALDGPLARVAALRARAQEALARIHATLASGQRQRLAAVLRHGPGRQGCRGHHAHA
jgi:uncharacterized membrane protein